LRQIICQNHALQVFSVFLLTLTLGVPHESFLADTLLRWDYSAPSISNFFFFWTTFLYVPTFFFTLLLLTYLFFINQRCVFIPLIILFSYLYTYEILETSIANLFKSSISYTSFQYNLLLINPLNRYHPFLLYVAVILTSGSVLTFYLLLTYLNPLHRRYLNKLARLSLKLGFIFTVFSLFLGSWWALQEGTWGGWWNWDPSEVFGLLYFTFYIVFVHETSFINLLYKGKVRGLIILVLIKWIYFFIQINFKIVSHNFGIQFIFFFNNLFFFIQANTYLTIFILYAIRNTFFLNQQPYYMSSTNQPLFSLRNNFFFIKLLLLVLVLKLLFIRSFQTMFFLFSKEYFNIDFFNEDFSYALISPLFAILVYFSLLRNKQEKYIYNSFFLQMLFLQKTSPLTLVAMQGSYNRFTALHFTLFLFFLINLLSLNDINFSPTDLGFSSSVDFNYINFLWVGPNYHLDGLLISSNHYTSSNYSQLWLVSANTFFFTNSTTSNFFFLLLSNTEFLNLFFLTNYENKFSFLVDFPHLSSLVLTLFMAFYFFIK